MSLTELFDNDGRTADRWRLRAACRGLDTRWWFTQPDEPEHAEALAICSGCEVRSRCHAAAVANHEPGGIWGGVNRDKRRNRRPEFPALHDPAWLAEQVDAGRTVDEIAAATGCAPKTVYGALGRLGLAPKQRPADDQETAAIG